MAKAERLTRRVAKQRVVTEFEEVRVGVMRELSNKEAPMLRCLLERVGGTGPAREAVDDVNVAAVAD